PWKACSRITNCSNGLSRVSTPICSPATSPPKRMRTPFLNGNCCRERQTAQRPEGRTVMSTLEQTRTEDRVAEKIKKVQELYADAPEVGRVALKNGLEALKHELAAAAQVQSAGRIGARQGKVSELTSIIPLEPGGGKRIRGLLDLLGGNFKGADV